MSNIFKSHLAHFSAQMELYDSNMKNILIFSQKEAFFIFLEIKKFLTFRGMDLLGSNTKKSQETETP